MAKIRGKNPDLRVNKFLYLEKLLTLGKTIRLKKLYEFFVLKKFIFTHSTQDSNCSLFPSRFIRDNKKKNRIYRGTFYPGSPNNEGCAFRAALLIDDLRFEGAIYGS